MNRKLNFHAIPIILCLALLVNCRGREPIRLGYLAEITGPHSEFGINGRDSVQLAVGEINAAGGINGIPLQLYVRDNKGIIGNTLKAAQELVEQEDVVAIIGLTNSGQIAEAIPYINQKHVVLLSPTATSSDFSGKKDFFFRLVPDDTAMGIALADYMHEVYAFPAYCAVYDTINRPFTESITKAIDKRLREYGEKIDLSIPFDASQDDLRFIAQKVSSARPQGVILLSATVETALLAQYMRQQGLQAQFFSTVWAHSNTMLTKGGQAVQDMILVTNIAVLEDNLVYQDFTNRYSERYNRPPGLDSFHAYEAVHIMALALKRTDGKAKGLLEALPAIHDFPGVLSNISFDAYGDVKRDVYIVKAEGNHFITVKVISPKD